MTLADSPVLALSRHAYIAAATGLHVDMLLQTQWSATCQSTRSGNSTNLTGRMRAFGGQWSSTIVLTVGWLLINSHPVTDIQKNVRFQMDFVKTCWQSTYRTTWQLVSHDGTYEPWYFWSAHLLQNAILPEFTQQATGCLLTMQARIQILLGDQQLYWVGTFAKGMEQVQPHWFTVPIASVLQIIINNEKSTWVVDIEYHRFFPLEQSLIDIKGNIQW